MSRFVLMTFAAFALLSRADAQDARLDFGGGTMQFQLAMGTDAADPFAPVMTFAQVDPGLPTEPPSLVRLPRVIDDLQLSDSQLAEIRERSQVANSKFQRQREELAARYGEEGQQTPEFADATNKLNESQKKELVEIVEIVLLPRQRDRLRQISTQAKLGAQGANNLDEFAKALDLTDEQKKKLTELTDSFESRLREEIKELRRKRQRELIDSVLTDQQEKKLDEMLGDELAEEKPQSADEKK